MSRLMPSLVLRLMQFPGVSISSAGSRFQVKRTTAPGWPSVVRVAHPNGKFSLDISSVADTPEQNQSLWQEMTEAGKQGSVGWWLWNIENLSEADRKVLVVRKIDEGSLADPSAGTSWQAFRLSGDNVSFDEEYVDTNSGDPPTIDTAAQLDPSHRPCRR